MEGTLMWVVLLHPHKQNSRNEIKYKSWPIYTNVSDVVPWQTERQPDEETQTNLSHYMYACLHACPCVFLSVCVSVCLHERQAGASMLILRIYWPLRISCCWRSIASRQLLMLRTFILTCGTLLASLSVMRSTDRKHWLCFEARGMENCFYVSQ